MNAVMAFTLLVYPAADADFTKAKGELRKALVEMDSRSVRSAAEKLAGNDPKAAVDVLLNGYKVCAASIKLLWTDKLAALQGMEKNKGFKINTNTNPPTIPSEDVDQYKRFQAAEQKGRETEGRIMRVEACKRSIVGALARCGDAPSLKQLLKAFRQNGSWEIRAAVAEALGRLGGDGAIEALTNALERDREPQVRIAAMDAVREMKPDSPEIFKAIVDQLGHAYWQVKATAVETLRHLGSKEAVEPLIRALAESEGRLRYDIGRALTALTGIDKHDDPGAWKAWWDEHGKAFLEGKYQPPANAVASGGDKSGTTFYGIPVRSRRVIFILDRSGSMSEPSDWKVPEGVKTGSGKKGDGIKLEGDRKIDIARWQLKRALALLPDGVHFNVVFYNHEYTILSQKMVKLDRRTRKRAFEFIDKAGPVGGTNCYDPIEKGLSFAAEGVLGNKIAKMGVDTIFFLTDGLPNAGQVPRADEIVVKVKELNKTRKVKINTVGVFRSEEMKRMNPNVPAGMGGEKFLKTLSGDSGGVYRDGKAGGR